MSAGGVESPAARALVIRTESAHAPNFNPADGRTPATRNPKRLCRLIEMFESDPPTTAIIWRLPMASQRAINSPNNT